MDKIIRIESKTLILPLDDVDTDQIIPARFLTTTTREGIGKALFADWRYDANGEPIEDFVLNGPDIAGCEVLVTGRNFGCGSSREHAPWALLDVGIRCVIASTFADIFYNNCFKNGILPITFPEEQVNMLLDAADAGSNAIFAIDLNAQRVTDPNGEIFEFKIDPFRKHCLFNGLDDIGLTLEKAAIIEAFEKKRSVKNPWLKLGP